jgi:hypothetical protein
MLPVAVTVFPAEIYHAPGSSHNGDSPNKRLKTYQLYVSETISHVYQKPPVLVQGKRLPPREIDVGN